MRDIDKAFELQPGYHYYEPIIYDLRAYYGGFNFRQLKRLMFVFSNNAMAYSDYYEFLECKKRDTKGYKPSEQETKVLGIYREVIEKMNTLVDQLWEMPSTENHDGRTNNDLFRSHYEHKYAKGRRWIKSIKELESQIWVRYTTEQGKRWGCGPTEEYNPPISQRIRGVNQNLSSLIRFGGHWVGYFLESFMESGDDKSTQMVDCKNFYQFIQKTKELYVEIQLIPELTVECDYAEDRKKTKKRKAKKKVA